MQQNASIFALATAPGRAGVAVFRISGPKASLVLTTLARASSVPSPRHAQLRKLYHPTSGELLDEALLIWFPAPHSFTGEDVVEIHAHGGRAITHALTEALRLLPGYRLAEPGEFSRRAFENDKLDLTEAEAIADLVDAETDHQRRQALSQLDGALGQLYEEWRSRLIRILAYFEAAIDFSDEDLPQKAIAQQAEILKLLHQEITLHLNDSHRGERLREGLKIAIIGAPNAGKSSLLNALARRDVAIVSSTAGTTRDVIEVHLDLNGYPVVLADTAGLRESQDHIENEGIRRARHQAEKADLKILVFDGSLYPELDATTLKLCDDNALVVINKSDQIKGKLEFSPTLAVQKPLIVSALTGVGLDSLLQRLIEEIANRYAVTGRPTLTRSRHRAALEECVKHLQRAQKATAAELCCEDVRLAMRALGRITGRVDVEDLLDVIFKDFCIGK